MLCRFSFICLLSTLSITASAVNLYANRVIEYSPAPGQFTNTATAMEPERTLGSQGGVLSLGGFGGYIVYGFEQPVTNTDDHPYGIDFSIGGNALVGEERGVWCEPGAVMVMKDLNGNGLPDDGEWYELAGSDYWLASSHRGIGITYYNPKYTCRHTVPWRLTDGTQGALLTNSYHLQPYYPDLYFGYDGSIDTETASYGGSLIKSCIDKRAPSYVEFYRAPAFGYFDSKGSADDLTKPHNPYYADANGRSADGFDISWAVDAAGNHVELDQIDFVKCYTAGLANAGWVGEWSSEITGIAATASVPGCANTDYWLNYIGLNRLQLPVGHSMTLQGLVFKNGIPQASSAASWHCSDTSLGSITADGVFTAKSVGTVWIYFSGTGNAPADSVEVEVVKLCGVVFDQEGYNGTSTDATLRLVVGETAFLNAESVTTSTRSVNGSAANRYIYDTYTWQTSNSAAGTLHDGLFTAVAVGTTRVTATSTIDPSLSAYIDIEVSSPPAAQIVTTPIHIAYDAPAGSLAADSIVVCPDDAWVQLLSASLETKPYQLSIEGNRLVYNFDEGDYFDDVLNLRVKAHGIEQTLAAPFRFGPDIPALTAGYAYGKGNTLNINGTAIDTHGAPRSIEQDSGFAFVTTDDQLLRIDLANAAVEACRVLPDGAAHGTATLQNRVYIAADDGVVGYYRSDLTEACRIEVTGIPRAVAASASGLAGSLYVVSSQGAECCLSTVALTATQSLSVTEQAIPSSLADVTAAATDGTNLLVAAGKRLTLLSCADGSTVGSLTLSDRITGMSYDADRNQWAVATAAGVLARYDSAIAPVSSDVVMVGATTVAPICAVDANNSPVAAAEPGNGGTGYEPNVQGTPQQCYLTMPRGVFSDDVPIKGRPIYPRLTDDQRQWISVGTLSTSSLQLRGRFPHFLDTDTTVCVEIEYYDDGGAAAIGSALVTIKPRVYAPIPTPLILDLNLGEAATVDVADLFLKPEQNPASNITYAVTLTDGGNTAVGTATLTDDVLSFTPTSLPGILTARLTVTATHKSNRNYAPKSVATSVTFRCGLPRGDVNADGTIDSGDVSALLEIVLTASGDVSPELLRGADINDDGAIDSGDVSALLEIVLSGY